MAKEIMHSGDEFEIPPVSKKPRRSKMSIDKADVKTLISKLRDVPKEYKSKSEVVRTTLLHEGHTGGYCLDSVIEGYEMLRDYAQKERNDYESYAGPTIAATSFLYIAATALAATTVLSHYSSDEGFTAMHAFGYGFSTFMGAGAVFFGGLVASDSKKQKKYKEDLEEATEKLSELYIARSNEQRQKTGIYIDS